MATGCPAIYRTTHLLIKHRGALEAEIDAAQRADELLAAGDLDGWGVWLRFVEAVKELSEAGPPPDAGPCISSG